MADELVLTRSPEDRRRYDLAGIGSILRGGWLSRRSELVPVSGPTLTAEPRGFWSRAAVARTASGEVVGEFAQKGVLSHGGEITWPGRSLRLRSEAVLTNRYSLHDADTLLLEVRARGWGRTPARVTLSDERVDPGLVLYALWLVQDFISQDSAGASG